MRKSRFNEAQIIGVLREQEAGSPTDEVWAAGDQPADFLSDIHVSLSDSMDGSPVASRFANIYPASSDGIGAPKWGIRYKIVVE